MKTTFPLLLATILFQAIPAAIAQTPQRGGTPQTSIPAIKPGNIVQLRGETPLTFQGAPFRNAGANEEFVVLSVAQDQQKLYLSTKDKSGLEIAIAAFAQSVTRVVALDRGQYGEWTHAMVTGKQYAGALAIFLICEEDPRRREEANASINRLKSAETAFIAARTASIAAQAETTRTLRQAERTRGDGNNPPFARAAATLRNKAKTDEATALQSLANAEANKNSAFAAVRDALRVMPHYQPPESTGRVALGEKADGLAKTTLDPKDNNLRETGSKVAIPPEELGLRIEESQKQFLKWKAETEEKDAAMYLLGGLLLKKAGEDKRDDVETQRMFQQATIDAALGQPEAQLTLAGFYRFGGFVPEDQVESIKWIRKAAEQGLDTAQYSLAECYAMGRGLKRDNAEAMKWYRKAAEQGDASAQYYLGIGYRAGEGVTKDFIEAYSWWNLASLKDKGAEKQRAELELLLSPEQLDAAKNRTNELRRIVAGNAKEK
jgi:TPR repeat protein